MNRSTLLLFAAVLAAALLADCSEALALIPSGNLLNNPGAETCQPFQSVCAAKNDSDDVAPWLWTRSNRFTVVEYGSPGGFPASSYFTGTGSNFFAGGPAADPGDGSRPSASQDVDVSNAAPEIDGNDVEVSLSGWVGGYAGQLDLPSLRMTYYDAGGAEVGSDQVPDVTPEDRGGATTLLPRSTTDRLPAGARTIRVTMEGERDAPGTYSDAYFDNIDLRLTRLSCPGLGLSQEGCGDEPVILIPGFLGTKLSCSDGPGRAARELWPHIGIKDRPDLRSLRLASDGSRPFSDDPLASPFEKTFCNRNVVTSGLTDTVSIGPVTEQIYGKMLDFLDDAAPGRAYAFTYDWRKSPGDAVAALDRFIDQKLAVHRASKAVIVTHSNGGLVTRWYAGDPTRARKLARVLDFATPFWGSPKAWLPLAHGNVDPDSGSLLPTMDSFIDDGDLREFSRNLTGLYFLFPSRAWFANGMDPWLTLGRTPLGADATASVGVPTANGNPQLLRKAYADRDANLSGLRYNGVDVQLLAGSGLPTLGGYVEPSTKAGAGRFTPPGGGTSFIWTNGDATVPLESQVGSFPNKGYQGTPGVKRTYFCGVGHVDEMSDPALLAAVQDYVADGTPLRTGPFSVLRSTPCPMAGSAFTAAATKVFIRSLGNPLRSSAGGEPGEQLTLDEAGDQGLIDIVQRGALTTFTVAADTPVEVDASGPDASLRTSTLTDKGESGVADYGPVAGTLSARAANGKPAVVQAKGKRVKPRPRDRTAPRTVATVKRAGKNATITFRATDASGVAGTYASVGGAPAQRVRGVLRVPLAKLRSVTFYSVDIFGNAERARAAQGA